MAKKEKETKGAEKDAVPEAPILARYASRFHIVGLQSRMLQNGNKIRVVLEGEYAQEVAAGMSPMFDKDCDVSFEELASKRARARFGEEDTPQLPGILGGAVGPSLDDAAARG